MLANYDRRCKNSAVEIRLFRHFGRKEEQRAQMADRISVDFGSLSYTSLLVEQSSIRTMTAPKLS
jgi:hypothetical protein